MEITHVYLDCLHCGAKLEIEKIDYKLRQVDCNACGYSNEMNDIRFNPYGEDLGAHYSDLPIDKNIIPFNKPDVKKVADTMTFDKGNDIFYGQDDHLCFSGVPSGIEFRADLIGDAIFLTADGYGEILDYGKGSIQVSLDELNRVGYAIEEADGIPF